MNIIALIPARAGSKRIPGKNIKPLGGKPLIQWTIEAAQQSGIFGEHIYCCTDDYTDDGAAVIAARCGVTSIRRPLSTDDEPDIVWVRQALNLLTYWKPDAFAILRPTSPFRSASSIRGAWLALQAAEGNGPDADSIRSVRPVREHPAKVWRMDGLYMKPAVHDGAVGRGHSGAAPFHSSPTQILPPYFAQTAGLEIAWTRTVQHYDSIAGELIVPFHLDGWEALDINDMDDWNRAEAHAQALLAGV